MTSSAIAQYLSANHPDIYNEISSRLHSEPCSIKTLLALRSLASSESKDPFYQRIYIICASLVLFSPETIHADCRVKSGVVIAISEVLGVSRPLISSKIPQSVHYYRNVGSVTDIVDKIVKEVRSDE